MLIPTTEAGSEGLSHVEPSEAERKPIVATRALLDLTSLIIEMALEGVL